MQSSDAALIVKTRNIALGSWLSTIALGVLSVAAKAAGFFKLGGLLFGLAVLSGVVFVGCVAFLMFSAIIMIATGSWRGAVGSDKQESLDKKWFLLLQRAVSVAFIGIGLALSPYILYRHGLRVGPVHDRAGNVVGHVNYFVFSLFFSAFWTLVSCLGSGNAKNAGELAGSRMTCALH